MVMQIVIVNITRMRIRATSYAFKMPQTDGNQYLSIQNIACFELFKNRYFETHGGP